jgi:hypothetical protein
VETPAGKLETPSLGVNFAYFTRQDDHIDAKVTKISLRAAKIRMSHYVAPIKQVAHFP